MIKTEDIFTVEYGVWSVTVSLSWDKDKHETVGETDHIGTSEAEAMAIGLLWRYYGQEIIDHIQSEEKKA